MLFDEARVWSEAPPARDAEVAGGAGEPIPALGKQPRDSALGKQPRDSQGPSAERRPAGRCRPAAAAAAVDASSQSQVLPTVVTAAVPGTRATLREVCGAYARLLVTPCLSEAT